MLSSEHLAHLIVVAMSTLDACGDGVIHATTHAPHLRYRQEYCPPMRKGGYRKATVETLVDGMTLNLEINLANQFK